MITYNAEKGQTLTDICLNTYGTLDYYYKLIQDNNTEPIKSDLALNADHVPTSGEAFVYDETLIFDNAISQTITLNNIRYSTGVGENGNTYYIIQNTI